MRNGFNTDIGKDIMSLCSISFQITNTWRHKRVLIKCDLSATITHRQSYNFITYYRNYSDKMYKLAFEAVMSS